MCVYVCWGVSSGLASFSRIPNPSFDLSETFPTFYVPLHPLDRTVKYLWRECRWSAEADWHSSSRWRHKSWLWPGGKGFGLDTAGPQRTACSRTEKYMFQTNCHVSTASASPAAIENEILWALLNLSPDSLDKSKSTVRYMNKFVYQSESELTACVLSLSTVASISQICCPSENRIVWHFRKSTHFSPCIELDKKIDKDFTTE